MFKNLTITSVLGITAIVLGAFGAHALKNSLNLAELTSFEIGVRYQMYHVLVLLFVNGFEHFSSQQKNRISYLFFAGIVFFSGSIYAIQLIKVSPKYLWFITPLGGFFFLLGWGLIFNILLKKTFINHK